MVCNLFPDAPKENVFILQVVSMFRYSYYDKVFLRA